MPSQPAALSRNDLPLCYRTASHHSAKGQRAATTWLAAQLTLLAVGAVLGAVNSVGMGTIHLGYLFAASAMLLSLFPATWLAARNPQRAWYEGRAAAESIKSLSWKYALRAEPFAGEADTDLARLESDLSAVQRELKGIAWTGEAATATGPMRALRESALPLRKEAYRSGRIATERRWYREKADHYARQARWWNVAAVAATTIGLLGGFLEAFGALSYDLLGSASAVAAGATAWSQMKQFRPLSAAYALTDRELAAADRQLEADVDEREWALRASSAEDAISREHTMWLARREAA